MAEAEMTTVPGLMDQIIERVPGVAHPRRITLFGSSATGTMTADSDIDLLILATSPVDPKLEVDRILRALRGLGYPFDVIVMPTEQEETMG